MESPLIRSTLAILLSVVIAFVLVVAVETISSVLHPWPDEFSGSLEEIVHQVESYSPWVLALLGGVGYGTTMFVCTFVATRLGSKTHTWHGYGIGLFLFAMVVLNMTQLPYPVWFWVMMFTVLPVAAYFGTMLGTRNTARWQRESTQDAE